MEQKDSVVIFTRGCDNVESKFFLQSWLEVTLLASPRHVGEWQKDWHHARLCTALPYHCTVYSVQCTSLTLSLYSVHLLPYNCTVYISYPITVLYISYPFTVSVHLLPYHCDQCTVHLLPYHCTVYISCPITVECTSLTLSLYCTSLTISLYCTSLTLSLYSEHLLPYHCTAKILALRNHKKSETVQNIPNFCLKLARLFNEIKIWLIKGKM